MKQQEPQLIVFPSGLRLVCASTPRAGVEYFGVMIDAGSRDDPDGLHGLAHFVEHTIFKGTTHRRSSHIINRMESVGGELNAYTTKQSTSVYAIFPTGNLARAVELVADLVINSSFPESELRKEREVVADEINSYLDIPSEAVFDDFEDLLFAGSALGHNILGNAEALSRFDSRVCRDYITQHYVSGNMVAFYSGPRSSSSVESLVNKHFASLRVESRKPAVAVPEIAMRFNETRQLDIHQSHTVVGARVCDMFDDRRYPLSLLVNMLGGPGMNSLLNVALREKRGLVYSVDASLSLLTDCGAFTLYYGCDPEDSARCRSIVDRTIADLCENLLTPRRLSAAIRQYVGQMTVSHENRENAIMSLARQALYRNALTPSHQVIDRINAITPDQLRSAALSIAPHLLSSLTFQ